MDLQLLRGKCTASDQSCLMQARKLRILLLFAVFTFFSNVLSAQEGTVTGRVTAGDTALAGVTVAVKGTPTATQTDANGNFTISASPKSILLFSSVGYISQEIAVGSRKEFSIQLKPSANSMSEVIVVGYGTQRICRQQPRERINKLDDAFALLVRAREMIHANLATPRHNRNGFQPGNVEGLGLILTHATFPLRIIFASACAV